MKKITALIICLFALSSVTFAASPAGVGQGVGNPGKGQGVGKVDKFNKFDKTNTSVINGPPGLQDKGMPPGLSKKNKTPPGWNKGEKRGWDDNDNVFKRSWNNFLDLFK